VGGCFLQARGSFSGWLVVVRLCLACFVTFPLISAQAQTDPAADPDTVIETDDTRTNDDAIRNRIAAIFAEIESLQNIDVEVREGVVTLSGSVANNAAAERAQRMATRLQGVVTVEDRIERSLDVTENVTPLIDDLQLQIRRFMRAIPLYGVALLVFFGIAIVGSFLANRTRLLARLLPNTFLADLMGTAIRVLAILIGLITALNLVGATAVMGAILGGAGVLGLAIGFAIRDSLENYISSIMLSLRQPFRANEFVRIGEHEGKVIRLTSRATILLTLDGNHLRIPNATVFKSVILNYTRNPERQFSFELGIDAADAPLAALQHGVETMKALDFLLPDPEPFGMIMKVGDSNIVLKFLAWVDQRETDFMKARGAAIAGVKRALENGGFTLPEPIYRLRIDTAQGAVPGSLIVSDLPADSVDDIRPEPEAPTPPKANLAKTDVAPDTTIDDKVAQERAETAEVDLLDDSRPTE